jgi:tRNA-splicing ligase RtcB (3'-phosphate/5'-hydroxy nucleic acid ligase)
MTSFFKWLTGPLPSEVRVALERLSRCEDVRHVAVMPDVHLAHDVCIGTVLATSRLLYPSAVGGDIGCGMSAMAFDAAADELLDRANAARMLAALYERVPANRHRSHRDLPVELSERPLSHASLEAIKRRDARVQLGTLGRGNHFLEFQADAEGRLWVMLHTGSRGVGQAIRDFHLERARQNVAASAPLVAIDSESPPGADYLADMDWALRYAGANRAAILAAVVEILEQRFGAMPMPESRIDCHHNFVRCEEHSQGPLWVHRKGALSARDGEAGIIPGSMGSASFHVIGRGCRASLCSSSHGAGRAMSRDEARRTISPRDLERQMHGVWFDHRMAQRLRDEAPQAYKDIHSVMRAQHGLTRVARMLRPVLSYKGK